MSYNVSCDFANRFAIQQISGSENEKWIGGLLQSVPIEKLEEISEKIWRIISEKVPNKNLLTNGRFPGLKDLANECSLGSKSQLIRGRYFEFGFSDVLHSETYQRMQDEYKNVLIYRLQLELDFQAMAVFPEVTFRITEKSGEQTLSQHWVRV